MSFDDSTIGITIIIKILWTKALIWPIIKMIMFFLTFLVECQLNQLFWIIFLKLIFWVSEWFFCLLQKRCSDSLVNFLKWLSQRIVARELLIIWHFYLINLSKVLNYFLVVSIQGECSSWFRNLLLGNVWSPTYIHKIC